MTTDAVLNAVREYDRSMGCVSPDPTVLTPSKQKRVRVSQPVRAHATPICRQLCQQLTIGNDPVTTLKREEFAVGVGGAGYADIGLLRRWENFGGGDSLDVLSGYEIKSAADSLARFSVQRRLYDDIFDFNTLIVTANHWAKAENLIRPHWGLWIARPITNSDAFTLEVIQGAKPNPYQERLGLVDLLWKDELIKIMDILQPKTHRLRRYGKDVVRSEVLKALPDAELKQHVYARLRARTRYWWNFEDPPREMQP